MNDTLFMPGQNNVLTFGVLLSSCESIRGREIFEIFEIFVCFLKIGPELPPVSHSRNANNFIVLQEKGDQDCYSDPNTAIFDEGARFTELGMASVATAFERSVRR